jgi:hypothetical protein
MLGVPVLVAVAREMEIRAGLRCVGGRERSRVRRVVKVRKR